MWKIYYSIPAAKYIKLLESETRERIRKAIESLQINPDLGKQLVGSLKGLRSLRVGKYRIIYKKEMQDLVIFVIAIGLRKNIYKD